MSKINLISGFGKTLVCAFFILSLNAYGQNVNQNQNNNAGNTNQQNHSINNPYTTIPQDSLNHPYRDEGKTQQPPPPQDAQQQHEQILKQSGQNKVIIPPNAAGPDTNVQRIPGAGNFNKNAFDTIPEKKDNKKAYNSTLTGSPGTVSPVKRDTLK